MTATPQTKISFPRCFLSSIQLQTMFAQHFTFLFYILKRYWKSLDKKEEREKMKHLACVRAYTCTYNANAWNITFSLIVTLGKLSRNMFKDCTRGIALSGMVTNEQSLCWEVTEERKKNNRRTRPPRSVLEHALASLLDGSIARSTADNPISCKRTQKRRPTGPRRMRS